MENTGRTTICSIVFLDIVAFSTTPDARQMAMKTRLNAHISDALDDIADSERIVLDTGDGAAICFLGDPEDALFVTTAVMAAIRRETGDARQLLRVGINLGPIKVITDLNGRPNVVGDGINVAQRVMSFASDDEILVSRSYFEVVARLREGNEKLFRYLGAKKDKHVREHQIYAISPELEQAYTRSQATSTDQTRRPSFPGSVAAPSLPSVAEMLGEDTLEAEIRRLTERIGPLAKVIVRRTAGSTRTMEEFYAGLAATISDQADRADFLAGAPVDFNRALGESADVPGPPAGAPSLDDELLSQATRHLAEHIGPLARVIVRKAAVGARDRDELYSRLAAHISGEDERTRFLATIAKDTA